MLLALIGLPLPAGVFAEDPPVLISRKLAKELKLPVCDLRKAFLDHLKENNPKDAASGILTTDGVHLNDAGNKYVVEAVLKAIGG